MIVTSEKSHLDGAAAVPASKSHTIRAVILGALADGESAIEMPLDSFDTRSAVAAVRALGAGIETGNNVWLMKGIAGRPKIPDNIIDVGNSGTTLYMIMGTASLVDGITVITGDEQIRRRTASHLIDALNMLGAEAVSTRRNGLAPVLIKGPLKGGNTSVAGVTSQYVSSLLMACPFGGGDSEITVTALNERPYVHMTLDWLKLVGIDVKASADLSRIFVLGSQTSRPFSRRIPGDFSSATFLVCAAVLSGGTVSLAGLDMNDSQGDKAVVDILRSMGADISVHDGSLVVRGGPIRGAEIDMNAIPDAIPMLSVIACFASGTTVLGNVPQARLKETDRIGVMARELAKLGADVKELPDGLVIRGGGLRGGNVHGHGDHRVVMAMTIAGFASDNPVKVDTAEAAGVTFPGFWDTMRSLGAHITEES